MWEKVVLNLLSNAFKFTFEGEVAVALRTAPDALRLVVRDTGIGIAADELPRLFERFHRVEGTRARTQEGTGIGLALVQELVALHGGGIAVESALGRGTAFTVTIPTGSAHLPAERIGAPRTQASTALGSLPFLDEALGWLSDDSVPASPAAAPAAPAEPVAPPADRPRPRILLADDNRDMREYVVRLLRPAYAVRAVTDGEQALASALADPPDLVLSDVMMPGLDGFGLVSALRADPRTREVPIVLLSARAGEEARIEGVQAGADDYLVKPFAAKELLARIESRLELSRLRARAREQEAAARRAAEAATRARDEFLSIASHELRNPVAGIKGAAQLLQRMLRAGRLDDERLDRYLASIEVASNRLTTLTEDLLDVSRLQQGALPLRLRPTDVGTLIRDVVSRLPEQTRQRVRTDLAEGIRPLTLDPDRVEQVVVNLLDNAAKYSDSQGEIDVGLEPDGTGVLLRVRDRGIGLPAGAVEQIFQPFGRAANAQEANIPGLGLGLYICRRIAEQHGGTLWAESAGEGLGTTMLLRLPSEPPTGTPPHAG
jgi:signal transduction histidine kinase